jgi:hypothetical protein
MEIAKMKKMLLIVLLASICLMLSGCVFSIGGGHSHKGSKSCLEYINSDPELAEIRAVSRLMSDTAKSNIYNTIAQRPGLSPKARAFLVDEATTHLMSDTAKGQVLMTLAKNTPAVAEQAK